MESLLANLFVVGAAKAGTTSLCLYMQQHPDIYFSPVKEPKFFSFDDNRFPHQGPGANLVDSKVVRDADAYQALFTSASGYAVRGEASVDYLYFPGVPERIRRTVPDAKIVIVLRDPVERAYSAYMHYVRDGWEMLPFEEALAAEESRRSNNWEFFWHYYAVGLYAGQVERYYRTFPQEQIKVILFDDMMADMRGVLRDLFIFLSVDPNFVPDISEKHNVSGQPVSRTAHNFFFRPNPVRRALGQLFPRHIKRKAASVIRKANVRNKQEIPENVKQVLRSRYRDDLTRLQSIIQRDLSSWMETNGLT